MTTIYLAGPLFDISSRHHNLLLEKELRKLGYEVILPQREAARFFDGNKFDLKGIREDCREKSVTSDVVVANIDGTDADAGTAVEVGIAVATRTQTLENQMPKIVCVRTDFRTDMAREIGLNGMLLLADKVVYKPAFAGTFVEVKRFYLELAREIHNVIRELEGGVS